MGWGGLVMYVCGTSVLCLGPKGALGGRAEGTLSIKVLVTC